MDSNSSPKGHHVCPWWLGYTIDNALRRMIHDPEKMLAPYVREGMRVLDVGCGMGLFSIGMAKLVGPAGKVFAVDLQQQMLDVLATRSREAGVAERIQTHRCAPEQLGITEPVDFALAFYMMHEAPHSRALMEEVYSLLQDKGRWLVVEPKLHVSAASFAAMRTVAGRVGFSEVGRPEIRLSHAVLLEKPVELVLE
jgi:ubiquinone/menaquinone biosynthesis C-methylase UbiE